MDSTAIFLQNASRLPEPLIRQLCVRARQGSLIARDRLLRAHAALIVHVAKYFYRTGAFLELDDLLQQGCLGLLHAINKFDPQRQSRGRAVKFATYAHFWISHSIRREIENHGRTVAVPIRRLRSLQAAGRVQEMDTVWLEDDHGSALARLIDVDESPDTWCRAWEARREVERLLSVLSSQTRRILEWRYGLNGFPGTLTQKQVGSRLSMSGTQIGLMERSALKKLRCQSPSLIP